MSMLFRAFQKFFNLNDKLKLGRCFIPQPPKEIGRARRCQSTRWNFFCFAEEPHKKEKINFLSLSKIEDGIGTRAIQKIGMLERTDRMRTRRPPIDNSPMRDTLLKF